MPLPYVWWANRKSRLGLSPIAKEPPPKTPGKAWWTEPPIAAPSPEHIEFVAQFAARLHYIKDNKHKTAMLVHVRNWMDAAKQLIHEESWRTDYGEDLETTDGILIAAADLVRRMAVMLANRGYRLGRKDHEICNALHARAARPRRERATTRAGHRTAELP